MLIRKPDTGRRMVRIETAGEMGRDKNEAWTWTPLEEQSVEALQRRI